jgi:hypothetical protein
MFVAGSAPAGEFPADIKTALEKADTWELYSLDPQFHKDPPKEAFHGFGVLGKTTVKDAAARKKMLAAMEKGAKDNGGEVAACFNPRHGIRIKSGDKTLDLVICFECAQVKDFTGDKEGHGYLTTRSPQPTLDKVLTDAKVPLPKN